MDSRSAGQQEMRTTKHNRIAGQLDSKIARLQKSRPAR